MKYLPFKFWPVPMLSEFVALKIRSCVRLRGVPALLDADSHELVDKFVQAYSEFVVIEDRKEINTSNQFLVVSHSQQLEFVLNFEFDKDFLQRASIGWGGSSSANGSC